MDGASGQAQGSASAYREGDRRRAFSTMWCGINLETLYGAIEDGVLRVKLGKQAKKEL